MASIGRGQLRCKVQGCNRVRPYWADECKRHREPVTAREAYESDLERKDEDISLELEQVFQDNENKN